jgi:glutaredoxin-like protein
MAGLLNDEIIQQIQSVFKDLKEPVAVLFFGEQENCQFCGETRTLLEEVTALSPKLSLDVYDMAEDANVAALYHVDKTPGIVIAAKNGDDIVDYGIRYAGIPSGHEFSSLINDLLLVSSRDSGLKETTRAALKELKEPITLQVYVTPT